MNLEIPVSVIIPCYRCDKTIERAFISVVNQKQRPAEIFLVDDFSDDQSKTIDLLMTLKKQHQWLNVKVIELKVNQGPSSARNVAWKEVTQPYIAFLDADDAWHPDKLALQYQWMSSHPDAVLTAHSSFIIKDSSCDVPKISNRLNFCRVSPLRLLLFNYLPTRAVMLNRDLKYRFFNDKRYSEDYLLWLLIVLDGHPAYYLDQQLSYSFKNDFGDSGLTSDIYKTHRGLIDTYRQLLYSKKIPTLFFLIAVCFLKIKLLRRYIIIFSRKLF